MSDGTILTQASREWATRPADERYPSLAAMLAAAQQHRDLAREKTVGWDTLRVQHDADGLLLSGPQGHPARLSFYAAGQLASRVGAPAGYIRSLPNALATENLNHGLQQRAADEGALDASLLFEMPNMDTGRPLVRAVLTEKYARIWNSDVVRRLIAASEQYDLKPAAPTFDWSGGDAHQRDTEPSLYLSNHDMFAFLMTQSRAIVDPVRPDSGLFRGVMVSNSEVGAGSLRLTGFLFRDICMNRLIWGARDIAEVRLTHVGNIATRWADALWKVRTFLDAGVGTDEAKLKLASTTIIAGTKDEVLDRLFGVRTLGASRKLLGAAYDAVVPEQDGPANTLYGMAQGLTRHSQTLPYGDERTAVDRIGGRMLDLVF